MESFVWIRVSEMCRLVPHERTYRKSWSGSPLVVIVKLFVFA
jgi:hypothetical protein